ncbi:MAG: hypothetical protein ACR2QF_07245 [Geminicoccaceae bacterium]
MPKDQNSAEKFQDDMRKAGFTIGQAMQFLQPMATALDRSTSHVSNLIYGYTRPGAGLQTRIDELIAAKGNGPVGSKHVLEPGEIMPGVKVADLDEVEPPHRHRRISPAPGQKYELVNDANGDMCVVQLVATFKDSRKAQDYLNWLNKEAG